MKRVLIGLSVLLALGVNGAIAQDADAPSPTAEAVSQDQGASPGFLPDRREASFLAPPTALVPEEKNEGTPEELSEESPITTSILSENTPSSEPVELSQGALLGDPVASKPLDEIDPETTGFLSSEQGGLGAAMWKGTSRTIVDRLLTAVSLPVSSPTLNDLARRLLLTPAAMPDLPKEKPPRTLLGLRVEKLVALGDAENAWKLALAVPPELTDAITMRLVASSALVGPRRKEVCEKIPSFIKDKEATEWQKALLVCKLQAEDMNAVQLGVDLLQEQKVPNDAFMTLVSRNVLARSKILPRQLTPLRPLDLAVLRTLGLPLPPELYARPEASLIPELLLAKPKNEKDRLKLAEKAAAQGLLSAEQLAAAYKAADLSENEAKGPLARAKAYQDALLAPTPQEKADIILKKFLAEATGGDLTGAMGVLAADMLADLQLSGDYNVLSGSGARLMAVAGRSDKLEEWLKLAQNARGSLPDVDRELIQNWPLFALASGDQANVPEMKSWLEGILASGAEEGGHVRRARAGDVLLLLEAAGWPVPEEAWEQVIDSLPASRRLAPSALLLERLRLAGLSSRKGEAVLLALSVMGEDPGLQAETIRALRQAGFEKEAKSLAREALAGIL